MSATGVTTSVTAAGVTSAPGRGQAGLPGGVIMSARGLEMSFGQTHALRGVDLDVAAASPSPVSTEALASARESGAPVILVGTDPASPGAIERARTCLATSGLALGTAPTSPSSIQALEGSAMENQFAQLGYIGILIAAGISAVSLGVSTVAALLGRRRVLGLLRLVGMPAATLRSMVSYEAVLPAATALVMSIGLGWLTAWSLIGGVSGRHISWPDGGYWLVLLACLALVVVTTLASARYGRRMLADSTVRFE